MRYVWLALLLLAGPAQAEQKAPDNALERGLQRAGTAIERGIKAGARGVDRGARAVSKGAETVHGKVNEKVSPKKK